MTAYFTGDIPAEDIVLEPERDGAPMDLTPFTGVEVVLTLDGAEVPTSGFIGGLTEEAVVIEWPSETVLTAPGLHIIRVTLVGPSARVRLPEVPVIVQGDDGWHTLDSARNDWPQAPDSDLLLWTALSTARIDCESYAPPLPTGKRPPVNYRSAQLMQARNTLNAHMVSPAGEYGEGNTSLSPFPLDWKVTALLRPKRVLPYVR